MAICVSVAKRRHALATDASPWDTRRRIIQESQRDGRCPMAGTERENGGVGPEFLVGCWFGSGWVREAVFGVSVIACRRFATLFPSGSYAHHGFAPMAIACRRVATRDCCRRVAWVSLGKRDSKPTPVNRCHLRPLCIHSLARNSLALPSRQDAYWSIICSVTISEVDPKIWTMNAPHIKTACHA